MSSRATQSELLEQRIRENAAAQEVDLNTWIFQRIQLRPQDHVLELCCGTGGQTLGFLKRLENGGRVVALDASRPALDTLASKAAEHADKLVLVQGSLDELSVLLQRTQVRPASLDLIFCAYGLYYSADARACLAQMRSWLKPGGRIVVVGPFGPNNNQLFQMVRDSGVVISQAVTDSSERFMLQTVLPWGATNFEKISVHTMVNPVRWAAPERVLNYWENTTFYDAGKRPLFEKLLRAHFERQDSFVNEKWVMMAEMEHARA
jgi:ubiquinone/menaquinone biosynthesis C-methylase UbiE